MVYYKTISFQVLQYLQSDGIIDSELYVERMLIMAGWDDILRELGDTPSPVDIVRRQYLKSLSDYTGR